MTAQKPLDPSDLNALAAEVMDIWQDHLAVYAADPKAKAELMHLLEPQRQLFADWAVMMQNSLHGAGANSTSSHSASGAANQGPANSGKNSAGAVGAASAAAPYDDGALRLAQLAHRVAELEKRLDRWEAKALECGPARKTAAASPKSSRAKSR